ncbi:MAG TPA: BrnT family toxin [bacterium]|nr:BrnT family toxin [bacterium]
MALNFEWDERKADSNWKKHRISFEEAATVFGDPLSISIPDPDHSGEEERFILLGMSNGGRLVVVVHVERGGKKRIISARPAAKNERRQYEQG